MKNLIITLLVFESFFVYSQTITNLSTHNYKGIPNNLEREKETVRPDLLNDINQLLPDGQNLKNHNPSLYNRSTLSFLTLKETSDVYLSFISEGADFKSSVGFYTFKGNPPSHPSQLYSPKVVFPNVSKEGILSQGDRVKLGNFAAGTSIGFFLIADGFRYNRVMQHGNEIFYTDSRYNPESDNDLKKHSVLIYDQKSDRFVLLFEDFNRQSGGDHDFNDAIFVISTGTSKAIDSEKVLEIEEEKKNQQNPPKVEKMIAICHYPPGNKNNPVPLQIPESAWPTHKNHGDSMGNCPQKTDPVLPTQTKAEIDGQYESSCVVGVLTIKSTSTGIQVKSSEDVKLYSYLKIGPDTYRNDIGNTYFLKNDSTLIWESNREIGQVTFKKTNAHSNTSGNKITICHFPPGNTDTPQTIKIPENAWPAHEQHGDVKGDCQEAFKGTEMEMTNSGFDIEGRWKLSRRPQINIVRRTSEGIEVRAANSNKWFLYKKVENNTYKDGAGNTYSFTSEKSGNWKSGNGRLSLELSKVKD